MHSIIKHLYITIFLMFCISATNAQEQLGLVTGNYAGVNGLTLNPASALTSKLFIDVNLISANGFTQNNFLYMLKDNYKLSAFFEEGYELPMHPVEGITGERPFYLTRNNKPKDFQAYAEVMGPSFMVSGNRFSYAVYTSRKALVNARNIPIDMANFSYFGLGYDKQRLKRYTHDETYKVSGLDYSEIGMSFSYTFKGHSKEMLSAGASVKYLRGRTGLYYEGNHIDYMVPDSETIHIYNFTGSLSFAAPMNYSSIEWGNEFSRGQGVAYDLGITYQKNHSWPSPVDYGKECYQKYEPYKYRIGLSLIDAGKIWFRHNARTYSYENVSAVFHHVDSLKNLIGSPQDLMDQVNQHFREGGARDEYETSFFINTPAALSLQFDYHLNKNWYLNSTIVQSVPVGPRMVHRPSVLAVTPRYESRTLELAMPVSLYDYALPRVGVSVRFYNITIGTDKIPGLFNYSHFSGLDLYVGLKINLKKGFCRETWANNGCEIPKDLL